MLFKIVLGVLSIAISTHVFKLVDKLGYLRYHHRHHPGTCRAVPGALHGSEDFAVTAQGDVFITTGLSWKFNSPSYQAYAKEKNVKGGIFLFHFSRPEKGVTPLTLKPSPTFDPSSFNPHGIDLIEAEGDNSAGELLLFVVSHPDNSPDRIEKFRYLPKTRELEHVKTFTDEKFKNLNDVAAVGPESFYTTNMCHGVGRVRAIVEMLAMLKWGSVLYRDSQGNVREAMPGLFQPNGITLSKDSRFVYVSAADILQLYRRHDNGSLTLVQEVFLKTHLDNIQRHPQGHTIFIGSHPKVHQFIKADEHPGDVVAPSQVVAIPLNKEGLFDENKVTELLYDHGDLISGSSVAAVFGGKMLVGSVIDRLAYCDMTTPVC